MIKEKDFIEIEYTGKTKDNLVFDTTDEKLAKDSGLNSEGQKFGPVVICLGEGHILKSLDNDLAGKEVGKEYTIEITAERAFGKKSAKMVQLIATNKFTKEGITPQIGLQVNVDGMFGTVRTVAGGRTMVDFNHPLAGQDVIYTIKVNKEVTDLKDKAQGLVNLQFGVNNGTVEAKEGEITIKHNLQLPQEYEKSFSDKVHELIPDVKKVVFVKEGK